MTGYEFVFNLALMILFSAVALALFRLLRGPSLIDRFVAFDLFSILTIGIMAGYTLLSSEPVLIDAAAVLAVITFLSTIALAYYVKGGSSL